MTHKRTRMLTLRFLTVAMFAALAPAQAYTLQVLHSFSGKQGENPFGSGLVRDSAGNLYGTTKVGGAANAGVVFKLSKTGKETVLYSFTGGADGSNPNGGVILDSAGNLYGTAYQGGAANQGVVFEVEALGTYKVLYNFCSLQNCTDGVHPLTGSLVLDSEGNLYGTAGGGGTYNWGTVFKLSTTGTETVLYNFTGGSDGGGPFSGVIRDSAGNLYGMTNSGGAAGYGVAFKLVPGPANANIVADCSIANSQSGLPPYPGSCGITNQGPDEAHTVRVSSVMMNGLSCTWKAPTENLTPGQSVSFNITCNVSPNPCNVSNTLTINGTFVGGHFSGTDTFVFCSGP